MRAFKIALPGLLVLALFAGAAAPPGPPSKPFANRAVDQLDYLFLASDRPVLIRLHLRAGDKPYTAIWEGFMDKLFTWFDKDNNGELSPVETARLVPGQTLQFQIQGSIGAGGNQTVPFVTLDKDKDGKVSKEEFREYYRTNNVRPLQFTYNNNQANTSKQVNDSIYRRLQRSVRGKLAKEDIARLPNFLPKLDENEDETLTTAEVNTQGDGESMYGVVRAFGGGGPMMPGSDQGLIEIQPTMTATVLAGQIMGRYDKNRDGKLVAGEGGLDKTFIASFDANKDGKLDSSEVESYFRRGPDIVLRGKVGPISSGLAGLLAKTGLFGKSTRMEVVNEKKLADPFSKKIKKVDSENIAMELGDARFTVQANEGQRGNRLQGVRQFYLQQFDAIANKDGYVERSKENDANRFISQLFTYADKNADAKLHRKEFVEWLDLMGEGGNAFASLQVNDTGRSLFNLMDLNGDSRLSIRELRSAWDRIGPLCKDDKGLAQTDLPRTLQVTMGHGFTFNQPVFIAFGEAPRPPTAPKTNNPMWFTKMDRNGDGDVSPKEWLGSEETFAEIDTDKDGLISGAEAVSYEAKKTKAPTKK